MLVGFAKQGIAQHQQPGQQQQQRKDTLHDPAALAALSALVQGWQGEEEQAALQQVLGSDAAEVLMYGELVEGSILGSAPTLFGVEALDLTQQMQHIHDSIQSQAVHGSIGARGSADMAAGSRAGASGDVPWAAQRAALLPLIEV
jgi:hypothetical protein